MALPQKLLAVTDVPVAILGYGVTGQGVEKLCKEHNIAYVVYDQRVPGCVADFTQNLAKKHKLVVYSPSFHPGHPWVKIAQGAGCWCLCELDLAYLFWQGPIVAVTGTNGKSTLTAFLAHAYNSIGIEAVALGNIGYGFSEAASLEDNLPKMAICEVSSYQSETLQLLRPEAVIWTSFTEDHLNYHQTLENYFKAKWRLVEMLDEGSIFATPQVGTFAELYGCVKPKRWVCASSATFRGEYVRPFTTYPQRDNYALLCAYWEGQGLPQKALQRAAKDFALSRHRLQCIATLRGVDFWDDSKATNFAAVDAALRSFQGRRVYWIGGGQEKGFDQNILVDILINKIEKAFLVGETGPELCVSLLAKGVDAILCNTLAEAVRAAYHKAFDGVQVVLSPGFASFDQFESYSHRGKCFEASVLGLKNG